MKLAIADGYKHAIFSNSRLKRHNHSYRYCTVCFRTGPIKGFATTLVIGILTSLFTSIFITRLIYEWLLKRNANLTFSIKITANVLKNTHIDFIGLRKYFYVVSGVILLAGVISLFVRGLNPGIDFTGGRTYVVDLISLSKQKMLQPD